VSTLAIVEVLELFLTQKCEFEAQHWHARTSIKVTQASKEIF